LHGLWSRPFGLQLLLLAVGLLFAPAAVPQSSQTPHGTPLEERLKRGREFLGLGPAPDAAAAALGQKTYAANCSFCHGANATGGEGPNLIRSSVVLHDEKGELIAPVVQNGRADKGMPAFPAFTPEQLYDIAEFLHQRVYDATNRWGYQVGNIVTGNAAAGQAYFDRHCASCHSPSGDLAHIAAKYEPVDLQNLFLYPGTILHVPVTVDIQPPNAERITGTLLKQDDFTIVVEENSGRISSWSTDQVKFQTHDPLAPHRDLLAHYTDADMHNLLAYLVTLK
jgi:cytochrome c oxidase cbb3-type subunit III